MVNAASKADFEPMERAVARLGLSLPERDETLANYMFMYSGGGVYAYKHGWTRQYVYLDAVGAIQDGVLNTGTFNATLDEEGDKEEGA